MNTVAIRTARPGDIEAMRARVANLKDMDIYQDPKVKAMLVKMLAAVR